jgi:excisionase family DNA binding protein
MTEKIEQLLTVEQVAEILQLSTVQVYRYLKDGRLPKVKLGRRAVRVRPEDLERFIEERREASDD